MHHLALATLFAPLPVTANEASAATVRAVAASVSRAVNHPPAAPLVTEPATDGLTLNPGDVHMETGPFSDPDSGDQHFYTDWEIWTLTPFERVWAATRMTGVERLHLHLGDGVFENSHASRNDLVESTDFLLRVRHSDDTGVPATHWSPWSGRSFRTGTIWQVFPLELDDVVQAPVPRWVHASDGTDVILPAQTRPPRLLLESAARDLLLAIRPDGGTSNQLRNPAALSHHVPVRIRIEGGSAPFALPPTDLLLVDQHCETHRIHLPAVTFSPFATQTYWVSEVGATYAGFPWQSSPDFTTLARGLSFPWVPRRQGFRVEVFAEDLQLPVNIAFAPNPGPDPGDPFLYVTELYGKIKVVTRDRTVGTYASGLLNFNPTGVFPGSGEQGLAGIVVDPATGDVLAAMLYASAANPALHYPKIVRFKSTDGGLTAATQTVLLDMAGEVQGQSHQVSNLTIAPDGKLLCHMGDGFIATNALNLDSLRGKILRLGLDGLPATDNPFYDAGDGISARDYVYAYGVRNPFGGDWRAADGRHYVVENGPFKDRFAQVVPGRNFGWDGSNQSMETFALYNWVPSHGPVNLVFVQPETFGGSGFPASLWGHAFVSESGPTFAPGSQHLGKRISEWILDGSGNLLAGPIPFLEYAGQGRATACGLEAGPDGLYMTELYRDLGGAAPSQSGARILRIHFDPRSDCNDNGIDDVCDISSGASADANANWVPDDCESRAVAFCFGDGTGVACPCGNTGLAGRGCDNSIGGVGGALLAASGSALLSADTLQLTASDECAGALSLFWQGDLESSQHVLGDGLSCLGGHLRRLYFQGAVGGTASAPAVSDLPVSARSAALGDPIPPGATRVYHVLYRDDDPSFCPVPAGSWINATNGLRVLWGP